MLNLSTEITNHYFGFEFSQDIVLNIWRAHQIKANFPDIKINTYSPFSFPKPFLDQFTNTYNLVQEPSFSFKKIKKQDHQCFIFMKTFMSKFPIRNFHFQFDYSFVEKKLNEKYICVVPFLSENWDNTCVYAGGRSVHFEYWKQYKQIANKKGYKVFCVGVRRHTGQKHIDYKQLADYFFQAEEYQGEQSSYLWAQLEIMAGATLTLGMGGGGYVAPVFGLPGITIDEFWEDRFSTYSKLNQNPLWSILFDFKAIDRSGKIEEAHNFVLEQLEKRL